MRGSLRTRTEKAEEWLKQRRRSRGPVVRGQGSPHQLSSCPWCGSKIDAGRDIVVHKAYRRTLVLCPDVSCPFGTVLLADGGPDAEERKGLPVLVVDEEIYRHPPSLLIGTVDKFAQLPGKVRRPRCSAASAADVNGTGSSTDDLAQRTGSANVTSPPPMRPPPGLSGYPWCARPT